MRQGNREHRWEQKRVLDHFKTFSILRLISPTYLVASMGTKSLMPVRDPRLILTGNEIMKSSNPDKIVSLKFI